MEELELKACIKKTLEGHVPFISKMDSAFFNSSSNSLAISNDVPRRCYDAIMIVARNHVEANGEMDREGQQKIKSIFEQWYFCLTEGRFSANKINDVIQNNLKNEKIKSNYLNDALAKMQQVCDASKKQALSVGDDYTKELNSILNLKDQLSTGVLFDRSSEAEECYNGILKALNEIRTNIFNSIEVRHDSLSTLEANVRKWCSLERTESKKHKVSLTTEENTLFSNQIELNEETRYFNENIGALEEKAEQVRKPMDDIEEKIASLKAEIDDLKTRRNNGEEITLLEKQKAHQKLEKIKAYEATLGSISRINEKQAQIIEQISLDLRTIYSMIESNSFIPADEKLSLLKGIHIDDIINNISNPTDLNFYETLIVTSKGVKEMIGQTQIKIDVILEAVNMNHDALLEDEDIDVVKNKKKKPLTEDELDAELFGEPIKEQQPLTDEEIEEEERERQRKINAKFNG